MECKTLTRIFFSPNGTTEKAVRSCADVFSLEAEQLDLLREPLGDRLSLPPEKLAVVGMPVYSGRLPPLCRAMLEQLQGSGTPAIAMVVYGNRAYDDALLELTTLLEDRGFLVIGAGAFPAQHSIFPKVAAGRPGQEDLALIRAFGCRCRELLEHCQPGERSLVQVRGNPDYRKYSPVPLKPSADKRCTRCGLCVTLCPTHSIPESAPQQVRRQTCIACGACIHNCPAHARAFRGPMYAIAGALFQKHCSVPQAPEMFYREKITG